MLVLHTTAYTVLSQHYYLVILTLNTFLFCRHYDLNQLLEPRSITADPLDYRLSWHLWEVLRALNYTHLSKQCEGVLQVSYAGQLESEGLWEWAIFVLLHIENSR